MCHFVGDGLDREALSTLVDQAGLSDKIRFLGRLSRDEIAQLLLDADVLAAPNGTTRDGRRVGIPVVLMESMGSGVPIVASNISGNPELVKDKIMGLLVPPRDAALLTDALETYYKEPGLRHQLGQAGRDRVLDDFDLKKNTVELMQHIIKDGRK